MATSKVFDVYGVGPVTVTKRKGQRAVRMRIQPDGEVVVSQPAWAAFKVGQDFARERAEWIVKHRPQTPAPFKHGDFIGKSHQLVFSYGDYKQLRTRVTTDKCIINIPHGYSDNEALQKKITQAAKKTLVSEAEAVLPEQVKTLAEAHGYRYASVRIKTLTSRWGSCDTRGHITLNAYLMQLPWHLINYVILHELAHTVHHNHSAHFWLELESKLPETSELKKEIKRYRPSVSPQ